MNNTAKQCTECGRLLTLDNYRKVNMSKDGYAHICKECAHQRRATKRAGEKAVESSGGGTQSRSLEVSTTRAYC